MPRRVFVFLAVGLAAASQSGNLIRLGEAHPVAMTAFRLLFATAVLVPLVGPRLSALARLGPRRLLMLGAAGAALAFHFFAWIEAVQTTTVANAAIFFSVNPVLTAGAALLFFREPVGPTLLLSVALGIGGVALAGLGDLDLRPELMHGNLASLVCAVLFTVYFLLGKSLRAVLPTELYVTGVYGVAALVGLASMLALGLPFSGYEPRTWLTFVLLALVPTLLGHTALNNALGYIGAGWIATATLVEPLLAGLVAFVAWGETVTLAGVAGYVLICLSVLVLAFSRPAPARARDEAGGEAPPVTRARGRGSRGTGRRPSRATRPRPGPACRRS